MRRVLSKINRFVINLSENRISQTIRDGMVMVFPVLLLGSFVLLLLHLPINGYQDFLKTFANGFIFDFLTFVYSGTFGCLSCFVVSTLSMAYSKNASGSDVNFGAMLSGIVWFFIFSGFLSENFDFSLLGASGMFSAIISALGATSFYLFLEKKLVKFSKYYFDGADTIFTNALASIVPLTITVFTGSIINYIFIAISGETCLQNFFIKLMHYVFHPLGRTFFSSIIYLFFVHFLWIFGIHGSDVLFIVGEHLFSYVPVTESIYSKAFFDTFVLMGGSGTTICLLVAMLVFGKSASTKRLGGISAVPVIFNINELLIFGLPIIYNVIFFIPFFIVPIVTFMSSVLAYKIGFLPEVLNQIEWTTPVFFSGYLATGSFRGVILQLFNICVGVLIYWPFIKIYEQRKQNSVKDNLDRLISILKNSEESGSVINLLGLKTSESYFANSLVLDLQEAIENQTIDVYYQPQYNSAGRCIGAEALMRWKHPKCGMMYPPLVVQLATESGLLMTLEKYIFERVASEIGKLNKALGRMSKVSINVSGTTIPNPEFMTFLKDLMTLYKFPAKKIYIEITEQIAVSFSDELMESLFELKEIGYGFAIDDFAMGHTSINYLKTTLFDLVKLDGSLIKDMMNNDRCKEIIGMIVFMSQSLGFSVLSEYVETEKQRKILESLGCHEYQGYLFSPAIPLEKL